MVRDSLVIDQVRAGGLGTMGRPEIRYPRLRFPYGNCAARGDTLGLMDSAGAGANTSHGSHQRKTQDTTTEELEIATKESSVAGRVDVGGSPHKASAERANRLRHRDIAGERGALGRESKGSRRLLIT
ncbi:hypothetical protein Bbelb_068390 [Branchiostoma belcheri]|nr:hypothetical protein Bbelb_068390 [Branchiostoma belcheri]